MSSESLAELTSINFQFRNEFILNWRTEFARPEVLKSSWLWWMKELRDRCCMLDRWYGVNKEKNSEFAKSDRLITIIHCNHEHGHYVSTMKSFLAKTFVIAMWKWPLSRKIFLEETLKPKINRNTIWYKLKHITSQIYKMIISYPDNCIPFVNDSGLNNFCFNGLFSWYRGLSLRFLSWLLRNLWVLLPACNNLLAADS